MDKPHCNCDEMVINHGNGKIQYLPAPVYPGAKHSCAEVRRRNTFLKQASKEAHALAGEPGPQYSVRFTQALSTVMDRLCAQGIDPRAKQLLKTLADEAA